MNFNELSQQLNLDEQLKDEKQLGQLKEWCGQNISQDIYFHGDKADQFHQYQSLAHYFLDEFMIYAQDKNTPITKLEDLTPIQYAAYAGYDRFFQSADLCLEDLNQASGSGMTPLHLAAAKGHVHTLDRLLNKGVESYCLNGQHQYPLFSALLIPLLNDKELITRKIAIYNKLLKHTPDILGHQDSNGDTVVQQIAIQGFTDLMATILQKQPELVFINNTHMHYPVHVAILNRQIEIVDMLLNVDRISSLRDSRGRMAIHYAGRYGDANMVALCCRDITNINTPDTEGKTPLHLAQEANNQDAVEALLKYGAIV